MDELQNIYRRFRENNPTCPSTEVITRYLMNELPEEERFAVEFHVNDCLDCAELMEALEAPEQDEGMDPARERKFKSDIAGRLDFRSKNDSGSDWPGFQWLWSVKLPLFVPASLAAVLVCVLVFNGLFRHWPGENSSALLPVTSVLFDLSGSRAAVEERVVPQVEPGEVLLLELFLPRLEFRPDDPVRYLLQHEGGQQLLEAETRILIDHNIRIALRLPDQGTYTVLLFHEKSDSPFEELTIEVVPE